MAENNLKPPVDYSRQSRTRKSSTASNISSRSSSPYRHLNPYGGLSEWEEPEEPLIQLGTPVVTPYKQQTSRRASVGNSKSELKSSARPTSGIHSRQTISLLDIDDNFSINDRPTYFEDHQSPTEEQACEQCGKPGIGELYCNVCDTSYCLKCWDVVSTHRKNKLGPGGVPHEKTNHIIAEKVRALLEPIRNDAEHEELHREDETTTWFGVAKDEVDDYIFKDYGRYAQLMAETPGDWKMGGQQTRFPSLVSFVGQTGAGKSTLIKGLIDLRNLSEEKYPTPVVGSTRHQNVPTSGDVHLYSDPQTFSSDHPILYADCEGLDGGEREPIGAISRKKEKQSGGVGVAQRTRSFEKRLRKLHHTSEREILWADNSKKRSRQYAVMHLYPRLLYTFSDVIVFVLKNPRTFESVLEKLLEWAASALETSSNQPALPHAIIACNASENSLESWQWDVEKATSWLMKPIQSILRKNKIFNDYADFWRRRAKRIDSVEDLLLSYYSSIRVVRIPTNGRPQLISDQISKLYAEIQTACTCSWQTKRNLRMLLNVEEFQPYLQYAFDHFSATLDRPFDFVQASLVNSPIPLDFGGNILKLAITTMETWKNKLDGPRIFGELSYIIASCIMLDSARRKIRGTAESIYPEYVDHLDVALENFCNRHWPCEYVKPGGGGRCVNVRSGHGAKGHQLENGKVLAVGEYQSRFSFESFQSDFRQRVYYHLVQLLEKLQFADLDNDLEDQAAAQIHKSAVLASFYHHVGGAENFKSHSACFSCLVSPPEHCLPCGHILCTPCLKAFGENRGKGLIEIHACPLHPLQTVTWRVQLKPLYAGVRILTLDGGGIRGIVELEVLRQLEHALGGKLPIQNFFDLIVGTSTGGIVALGLAAKGWSVDECTQTFEDMCETAFTRRQFGTTPGIGWLVENHHHSRYETQPLQRALIDAFESDDYLFGGSRAEGPQVKVAVVATSTAGSSIVLSNYNRTCEDKLPYLFQRPEKPDIELKIWEAARATSAAPRIFKSFPHEPSKQVYTDGGIYHNNPVQIADRERKLLWPGLPGTEEPPPDIILSVGTGHNPLAGRSRAPVAKGGLRRRGMISNYRDLYKIAANHIASSLDSEKAWEDYMNILLPPDAQRNRYRRINPRLGYDPPKLDDVAAMKDLQRTVRELMKNDDQIMEVAHQLVASSFYFERVGRTTVLPDGSTQFQGFIYCRMPQASMAIRELGLFIQGAPGSHHRQPCFVIQEQYREFAANQVLIKPEILDNMIRNYNFKMGVITITVSNHLALSEIFLCVRPEEMYPVSGFPRVLVHEEPRISPYPFISGGTSRWAGRTRSQKTRKTWVAPPEEQMIHRSDTISRYSEHDYVVGDSDAQTLEQIKEDLTNGPGPAELESIPYPLQELMDTSHPRPSGFNFDFPETSNVAELE